MRTFDRVPRISTFYGITIVMYYDDHGPPHFHARYGEHEAQIEIDSGELLRGALPRRARTLVAEWSALHRAALLENWARAMQHEPLHRIEPLP